MDETTRIILIVVILGLATLIYMNCKGNKQTPSVQTFQNVSANNLAPTMIPNANMGNVNSSINNAVFNNTNPNIPTYNNPQDYNINQSRNDLGTESLVLDELMQQVDTGNSFMVNSPSAEVLRNKTTSINSNTGPNFKKISYKDSQYRHDFGNDAESQLSKDELNNMYSESLVFHNSEYANNNDFKGYAEYDSQYGNADINIKEGFASLSAPQTQQEKVTSLYDANAYLPNQSLTNPKLEAGFQILNNPLAVSNPNLIPVLKSIPVASSLGSNKNATWDIRAEPPCPKTVISPFLNSSIMPDIYATQRGCLA